MIKKVLILGHKGMLGNAVHTYLSEHKNSYALLTLEERWGDDAFNIALIKSEADVVVNCIGIIPQKKPLVSEYKKGNIDLPVFLETIGKKIIHPSTDCEFSGNLPNTKKYSKKDPRDATDDYGKSKAEISALIEKSFNNTKIIRTSIIGHEEHSHLALLDWFLSSTNKVNGYTNHFWNGITTLQWAKQCAHIIDNWDSFPVLNQYGTEEIRSKYDLLNDIKNIYNKDIVIIPFPSSITVNKCLESDKELPPIVEQLAELKKFYCR